MSKRDKSAQKSAPGIPFQEGEDARRGKGPPKGEGGRPPDSFKLAMQVLVEDEEVQAYLARCIKGEFGPKFFLGAINYATDRGYGKPAQEIAIGASENLPPFIIEAVRHQ